MSVANPVPSLRIYIYTHTYVRTHSGALRGASAGEGGREKGGRSRRGGRNKEVFRFVLSPPSSVRWQQRGIVLDNGLRKEERREGGRGDTEEKVGFSSSCVRYIHTPHTQSTEKHTTVLSLSLDRTGLERFFLVLINVVNGKVRWEIFSLSWLHWIAIFLRSNQCRCLFLFFPFPPSCPLYLCVFLSSCANPVVARRPSPPGRENQEVKSEEEEEEEGKRGGEGDATQRTPQGVEGEGL